MRRNVDLSPRERELLSLSAKGLTDTAIAQQLGISEATFSTYWGRVRIKMGPLSRTELVAKVIQDQNERVIEELRSENTRLTESLLFGHPNREMHEASFFETLVEKAIDAMVIVNSKGQIVFVNAALSELLGYRKDELMAMPVSILVPERFRILHMHHVVDFVCHPAKKYMGDHSYTPALHKSGREILITASLSPVAVGLNQYVLCILRPVHSEIHLGVESALSRQ